MAKRTTTDEKPCDASAAKSKRSTILTALFAIVLCIYFAAFAYLIYRTGLDLIDEDGTLNAPLVVGTLILLALAAWWFPKLHAFTHHQKGLFKKIEHSLAENEFRKTLIQVMAGGAIILGVSQFALQLDLQWSAQLADRFSEAVEQLATVGDDNLPTRLGGIYALERIGADSLYYRDPVLEVLAAFVRQNATAERFQAMEPILQPVWNTRGIHWLTVRQQPTMLYPGPIRSTRDWPPPDVHACLTVLGRRSSPEEGRRPDLSRVYLRRAQLVSVGLSRVSLWAADLSEANLTDADLTASILEWTNLENANLALVNAEGADFSSAEMHSAILGASMLTGANLRGANLSQADLTHADLSKALLHDANLNGAQLFGANLATARGLTFMQLAEANGDTNTFLPPDLDAPEHWTAEPGEPR